jgi:hypothetical protein
VDIVENSVEIFSLHSFCVIIGAVIKVAVEMVREEN